jgi:murein DD-endopeptidase MepM/ murein hydrolase activator NlpD
MKKTYIFFSLFIAFATTLNAQSINIFYENKSKGYIIYASNSELYPISIQIDFMATNMIFSEGERTIFVVAPKSKKFKIGEMTVSDQRSRYNFSYKYKSTMGDITLNNFEGSIEYDLPFQNGKDFRVFQGYNGSFSHKNQNAIDFIMPEGTAILAAREGLVVQVEQNNTESCPEEECKKYNNYVTIMHSDGTFAHYAHIKYQGSKFKVGEAVKRGDVIALSGNVGWTSGPHLHFVCFTGGFEKWNTLATRFKINNGDKSILLMEGTSYQRNY